MRLIVFSFTASLVAFFTGIAALFVKGLRWHR